VPARLSGDCSWPTFRKAIIVARTCQTGRVYPITQWPKIGGELGPFQVTKEMIGQLSDEQLRGLLGALLEAEAMRMGVPPSSIDLGGNQTATDGGVDGSIVWIGEPEPIDWLPRRTIYFQCKAEAMGPAALKKEMRPQDKVRGIFAKLAEACGVYIVFTTDDPTKSAYEDRLTAMTEAIEDVKDNTRILLEFYGAEKIARWTNQHLGVAIWVLEQNGRNISGWRPYGDWSALESSRKPYLFDQSARVVIDGAEADVATAIAHMRAALSRPGGAVRLVGISGMGKTRLAEALFDDRIAGGTVLASTKAIYADLGLDVSASAGLVAEQLVLIGADAIIVADNTNIQTHAQLAQIVSRAGSRASVLTIDYDATGERPTGTKFVTLTDNSEDILAAVLEQRCPDLNDADRRHLARFSGGNARIALKIAESNKGEPGLANLKDSELLSRLFQSGRAESDPDARNAADGASLVYAFYVEDADGQRAEHAVLAEIVGIRPDSFYRQIATFLEWGVAQQRGPQRAIMPPPLANMLAAPFVRRSDPGSLLTSFTAGPTRLFASFARRLGHLHSEPNAVTIVERLFEEGGLLAEAPATDEVLRRAFINAAPAAPAAALKALRRTLQGGSTTKLVESGTVRREYAQLLVFTGHDASLFADAMEALLSLLIQAETIESDEQLRGLLLERFWPLLSFTLADGSARVAFVDRLLGDGDHRVRLLGLEALDHMLDAGHFSSSLFLELGSQQRTTEWRPHGADYDVWLEDAFVRLSELIQSNSQEAPRARAIVAAHFREHLRFHAEQAIRSVQHARPSGYWDEGWRAVCDALHFERPSLPPEILSEADHLERELRPKTLDECFEAFVLGDSWRHHHPNGREQPYMRNAGALAEAVGRCAARKQVDLLPYFDRAICASGHPSVGQFGRGLGRHWRDLDELWEQVLHAFNEASPEVRRSSIIAGILDGAVRINPTWVQSRLDEAVADPVLSNHIVVLHAGIDLDERGMDRFSAALKAGLIEPKNFSLLMMGGATKRVPAGALARFLEQLFLIDDGVLPALQILHMRIYGDRSDGREVDHALIELGRSFLADARTFAEQNEHEDHGIATIANAALTGDGSEDAARKLSNALREAAGGSNRISYRDFDQVCAMLAKLHPRVVVEEIVAQPVSDDLIKRFFGGVLRDDSDREANTHIDSGVLLDWVREDPAERAPRIARFIPYAAQNEEGSLNWSPLALELIDAAPDRAAVLEAFEQRFWTGAGWGSFSSRFVRRKPLVRAFLEDSDAGARRWARSAMHRLDENLRYWNGIDRERESRFE
jgi:hypothetical protein